MFNIYKIFTFLHRVTREKTVITATLRNGNDACGNSKIIVVILHSYL
jgi:hypothetical protein